MGAQAPNYVLMLLGEVLSNFMAIIEGGAANLTNKGLIYLSFRVALNILHNRISRKLRVGGMVWP